MKQATATKRKNGHKILASAISVVPEPILPWESDKKRAFSGKWVLYFQADKNAFPNDTAKRAKQSPTSHSIIQSKVVYTVGNGFTFFRKSTGEEVDIYSENALREYVENVNSHGQQLIEVYEMCARDLITTGNLALEIVKTGERLNVFHVDSTTVRLEKMDRKGFINYAYLSADWVDIGNNTRAPYEDKISPIPMWYKETPKANSLMFIKEYAPEFRYYGLPDHYASAYWQDIEYRIGRFNLDRFDNGFMPSGIVDLYGEPPDGKNAKQYIDEIVKKFTGAGNNSKILFQLLDSQEQRSNVNIFEQLKDGDFIKLQALARDAIIVSHRYTPSLAGVATAGTLGSNQQLMTEFEIVNNTVIKGYKQKLLKAVNDILEEAGFGDFYAIVNTTMPVSYASSIKPENVLTINEQRNLIGFNGIEDLEGQFVKQQTTENIDVTDD